MSQCLRCGRELIDPNAKYGWRCAQKVGIPYGNGGSLVKKFPELEKLYIFLPDTSKKKFDVYFDEMEEKNSYIDTAIEGAGMYMSIADELEKAYNEQISKKNEQNQRIDNLMKTKIEFEKNKKLEELQALDKMIEQYQNGSLTFENELDNKIQPDPIKIWTRADIVLDENDKKLSIPNQEKLIDEKLKWHNASDVKEQETAAQQGKQIRENDKITPDNFRDYSPEKQLEYIADLTKKSNIKLDERDMNYLSDFLSNDQELNLNEKGDMVKVLQKALRQIGFRDITMDTGNYSEKTRAAIASIVELVTGNKNSGSKIGKEEKAKFVQILSEVADGDTTIAQKLKDGFDANFNKERFDEVTGKNKVEEKKEEDSKLEDSEKTTNTNNHDGKSEYRMQIDKIEHDAYLKKQKTLDRMLVENKDYLSNSYLYYMYDETLTTKAGGVALHSVIEQSARVVDSLNKANQDLGQYYDPTSMAIHYAYAGVWFIASSFKASDGGVDFGTAVDIYQENLKNTQGVIQSIAALMHVGNSDYKYLMWDKNIRNTFISEVEQKKQDVLVYKYSEDPKLDQSYKDRVIKQLDNIINLNKNYNQSLKEIESEVNNIKNNISTDDSKELQELSKYFK